MTSAKEMREKSERGALERVKSIMEKAADRGESSISLSDYDDLWLTDDNTKELEGEGYKIQGDTISW